jgi:hypothetical protein
MLTKKKLLHDSDSDVKPKKRTLKLPPLVPAYQPDIQPETWAMPSNFGFHEWMAKTFKYKKQHKLSNLFSYQALIKDFMQSSSPYRGLLLYHGLGVGKTRTAISTAEVLSSDYEVVVLLPAALKTNFFAEVQKIGYQLFRLDQHWVFVDVDTERFKDVCERIRLLKDDDPTNSDSLSKYIKKQKGVWLPIDGKDSNLGDLDELDRIALQKQLEKMMEKHYKFIHYNGVNLNKIKQLTNNGTENPFDNKVVIIDEVHRFISRATGSGKITKKLYTLLMKANNMKLLLLTGTPITNKPIELAYIFNLLNGDIAQWCIKYPSSKAFNQDVIFDYLKNNKYIDNFVIQHDMHEVQIGLVPNGFEIANIGTRELQKSVSKTTQSKILDTIKTQLFNAGVGSESSEFVLRTYPLLPKEEKDFKEYFINEDGSVKNPMLLSRRIMGLVSYYESYNVEDYPRQNEIQYVHIPMTDEQFSRYTTMRQVEIEKERKAAMFSKLQRSNVDADRAANVYRSFTRAICNWVFPQGIERPVPSKMSQMKKEMDDDEINFNAEKKKKKPFTNEGEEDGSDIEISNSDSETDDENEGPDIPLKYSQLINKAIGKVVESKERYLKGEGLKAHGPKMYEIIKRLKHCKGSALIYSVFRTVEGLRLLSLAMDSAGYAQLKVKKNSKHEWVIDVKTEDFAKPKYTQFISGSSEETTIIMNIFNSNFDQLPPNIRLQLKKMHKDIDMDADKNHHGEIIKAIMITESGSEGISLKDVRQVHIMEPYWHNIRVQQVIGRAIRAKSHINLPMNEREVDVFMYLMKFNQKQKQDHLISTNDKGMTSDEHILHIATRKKKINDSLLQIVKNSAIDCHLNMGVHADKVSCFVPIGNKQKNAKVYVQKALTDDFLNVDMRRMTKEEVVKKQFVEFTSGEIKYIYDVDSLKIYLSTAISDPKKKAIGLVKSVFENKKPNNFIFTSTYKEKLELEKNFNREQKAYTENTSEYGWV